MKPFACSEEDSGADLQQSITAVREHIEKRLKKAKRQPAGIVKTYLRKPNEGENRRIAYMINERNLGIPPQIAPVGFESLL